MYSQFPDYGDFQIYDLGVGAILSQIDQEIYANPHKPSWGTSKRRLFMAEIAMKLFREIRNIDGAIKGRYPTGKDVWESSGNAIANTFNESVAMDFVDFGGYADFLHIRGAFSRFPAIISSGGEEKGRTNGRNGPWEGDSELVIGVRGARNYSGR